MQRQNDQEKEPIPTFVLVLRIFVPLQIIISVLDIVIVNYFLRHGIFGFFLAFVLFMAQRQLSYQILLIDIIISIYFFFDFFLAFLTFFQNGSKIPELQSSRKFDFSVILISFVYYAVVSIFCYFPYKHFKRLSYKENPALNHIFKDPTENQNKNNQEAKEVPYNPAYGQIEINPRKRNNEHGTFEVSKGKGIIM